MNGAFSKKQNVNTDHVFGEMAVGVAAQITLQAGNVDDVEMCLVWDMPTVAFPGGRSKYCKYYTKYFGVTDATLKIVNYAFEQYKNWEKDIYGYQKKVLLDKLVVARFCAIENSYLSLK